MPRARLKVEFLETLDDVPVWDTDGTAGYENALFRDVLAVLDLKERRLILALPQGETISDIAAAEGLRGHAAVSRRVQRVKRKIEGLLR